MTKLPTAFALALLAFATAAFAQAPQTQTLYKLIHPNGKIEYAEKPPKDFPGKVIPVTINPDANSATLPKYQAGGGAATGPEGQKGGVDKARQGNRVQAARDRLDAARKALKDAQDNPAEGEVSRMGNAGGGTRPVFTDAYQQRIASLEKAVKDAEEGLKLAESP